MANTNGYGHAHSQTHDLSSLENMLHQFRVNELQMFLGAFKIAKLGKKSELVDRARQLLYQQRPPNQAVINKIREIHTKRFVTMQQPQQTVLSRGSLSTGIGQQSAAAASQSFLDAVGYSHGQQYVTQRQQYGGTVAPSAPAAPTNRARGLRMVELPFYEQLHTIIEPTELLVSHPGKNPQDMYLTFSVPEKFISSVSYRSDSQPLPRIELQLRFFLLDLTTEQKDEFPLNCSARIDDQPIQLPNIIPTNKPNVEPKRPSRSVNITPYCQPPRYGLRNHRLQVTWTADKRAWAVCVSVVRRLTSEILLKRLRNNVKMHRAAEHTKRLIIRRLGGGSDGDDIAMDSLRVSLLCPLGKIRMTLPTKPAHCEHLQCFDAGLFLMMNEKKPTWKCPVCDNPARYSDLVVDGYFEQVLNEMSKSVTEVELLLDGTWKAVESSDGDDSDDDYASPAASTPKGGGSSTITSCGSGAKSGGAADDDDIIILDDSDDEPNGSASSSDHRPSADQAATTTATGSTVSSSAHSNVRLRPSPCSPTQSEGGGSSASDPSVICIDLADSSSSPPSRPGTGEANRASSTSTSLSYMHRTVSYSPSTPLYESMTPPVAQPQTMVGVSAGVRRPATAYPDSADRPPYKRMALSVSDDVAVSSLQLPTVSMHHLTGGYSHSIPSSTPGMASTTVAASYGQPPTYQQQQHSYHQQSNSSWMNNYQASVGYPQTVGNGYYPHHNGFEVATSSSASINGISSTSINGISSYHPSASILNSSALPDFANMRMAQDLQAFLNSIGMQQSSTTGVPFNHQ